MLSNACGILRDRSRHWLSIENDFHANVLKTRSMINVIRGETTLKKGKREGKKERETRKSRRKESLRFKIAVFCSRRRSTFHDKREGTTTTSSSSPKTAAPVFPPVTHRNGGQGSDEKWGNRI